jgi:hypothetical protein
MNKTIEAYAFIKQPDFSAVRKDIEEAPEVFVHYKLTGSYFDFGVERITSQGIYREQGFAYDLRPFLRKFLYKKYGSWHEIYALNKTNVRKLVGGTITKIIELNKTI